MDKKDTMYKFIQKVKCRGLMTKFIKNIFNYANLNDYNYIFRMINNNNEIIFDIYDNVTLSRFNRYVFSFFECGYDTKEVVEEGIFVHYISVLNIKEENNNLFKFAYLFRLDDDLFMEYAGSFLDKEFIDILIGIMKEKRG